MNNGEINNGLPKTEQTGVAGEAEKAPVRRPRRPVRALRPVRSTGEAVPKTSAPGARGQKPAAESAGGNGTTDRTRQISIPEQVPPDATLVGDTADKITAETSKKKRRRRRDDDSEGRQISDIVKCFAYVTFVLVAAILLSVFIVMVANDMYAFVKSADPVEVTIPENATLDQVADILHDNRIIKYPGIFKMYAKIKKDPCVFYAGDYTITAQLGYKELLREFRPKVPQGVSWVTIPEGYTTDEIIDLLVETGIGTREKYVDVINNYDFDYWFIDELGDDWAADGRFYRLDGYLFPDTYEFYNASSEETVINKMLYRFNTIFTDEYRQGAELMGFSVDDIITIASIVEKEAASPSDFSTVSSVFHNRLNDPYNFPYLETDASIVYAIQHETGKRPKLTSEDLKLDSPYNSYTHPGLPPGPISSPSNSAMLAALNPIQTNYYFFVSSGSKTYFSVTRAEHEAKVAEIGAGLDDEYTPEE
ncbi:MAG: endolytic transglycosylase MltG [Clostridia bacterium]|nr:endolytic transglycosylase MltG [Clostridia bacterium]